VELNFRLSGDKEYDVALEAAGDLAFFVFDFV